MTLLIDNPDAELLPHTVAYPLWVDGIPYATCRCHWWWQLVEVFDVSTVERPAVAS